MKTKQNNFHQERIQELNINGNRHKVSFWDNQLFWNCVEVIDVQIWNILSSTELYSLKG